MTAMECAQFWATAPCFDDKTRAEAAAVLNDENEVVSRFGRELAFGTGGLRGVLGVGTNRMNVYTVARATAGLAAYLLANGGKSVAISHDSRNGSREFALITAGVLAAQGVHSYLYDRLMPTPMLSFATRELHCDAGVMITASHNPAIYNGYKVYGADGCQITEEAAAAITEAIDRVAYDSLVWSTEDEARGNELLEDVPQRVYDDFIERTLACRVRPDECTPITVCYTPLNGTGLEPVRSVLHRMKGVTMVEVAEQLAPDGNFPTCPKPNPEIRETLTLAIETAKKNDAAIVIATDPDCDRIGIAVRQPDGSFTILSGNEVGLLLLQFVLNARVEKHTMPADAEIVKTIVTSDLAFKLAEDYHVGVKETLTGFKYIGEEIGRLEKQGHAERYVFGFEESCGYLAGTHVRDKDGVMAAMLVCELTQSAAAQGKTLSDLLVALYDRYGHMRNRLLNFDIAGADPMRVMKQTMATLREQPPEMLAGEAIESVKDYAEGIEGLPTSDVLTFANGRGKAIVRPSGTEPKVKVYLSASASTDEQANAALDAMEADAKRWLS